MALLVEKTTSGREYKQQEDEEKLVPHSDLAENNHQPTDVIAQTETASTVENQPVEDPPSSRFTWRIDNFSRLNAKKLYSELFVVGGFKWRVLIFPKGNNVDHLSMYLDVADSSSLPYGWSRYAQFSLAVVNQIHHKYSVRKDTQHQFNAQESDWGFTSLMPLGELSDPSRGYLVNGSVIIEAELLVSPTVHDAHHSKEPPELQVKSSSVAIKGMSLEEFLEKFAEDEENEKVATDFYPLSSDTVMFQRSEIPAEGQPLLAAIVRKHPHFMAGCKLGAPLRKSGLQLLIAVLLDMQRTKLESSNLKKALEWKNALKDLLFMKFGVQFILDKIRATAEACIARDDEFTVRIVDLEREIATKRAELSLLLSQRDEIMRFSSAGGASSSAETFGDGLFD